MTVSRELQLITSIPRVFDYKTLLYIGAKLKSLPRIKAFIDAKYKIDIVEIYARNVAELCQYNKKHRVFRRVFHGDVRNLDNLEIPDLYDVVMWWHGPEHVTKREVKPILDALALKAKKYMIVACPHGVYVQGEVKGNVYETHQSYLYPEDFANMGMKVNTQGKRDVRGGNIIAWREM